MNKDIPNRPRAERPSPELTRAADAVADAVVSAADEEEFEELDPSIVALDALRSDALREVVRSLRSRKTPPEGWELTDWKAAVSLLDEEVLAGLSSAISASIRNILLDSVPRRNADERAEVAASVEGPSWGAVFVRPRPGSTLAKDAGSDGRLRISDRLISHQTALRCSCSDASARAAWFGLMEHIRGADAGQEVLPKLSSESREGVLMFRLRPDRPITEPRTSSSAQ